jgi:hypothetical protein
VTIRVRLGATMALALALAVVAGCSPNTDPGHADPTSTTSTSVSGSAQLSRPKDLKIANIDPCVLLTDAQIAQMNAHGKGSGPGDPEAGTTSSCSYLVTKPSDYTLNVSLEPKRGVETWLGGKYEGQDLRQLTVQSYPAVQTLLLTEKFTDPNAGGCQTLVSTAAGQELDAGVIQTNKKLSTTQLCDVSKQLATLALTTLQANQ